MTLTRKAALAATALGVAIVAKAAIGHASDHIDGLKTAADGAADLSDVYAFVSPQDATKMVLVMDVHPLAIASTEFSDAVSYRFRLRPIADTRTLLPSGDATAERDISCTFADANLLTGNQHATCVIALSGGTDTVTFDTRGAGYTAGGSGTAGTSKVFAGVRSDPWFVDLGKMANYNLSEPVTSDAGTNSAQGQNVLSIVVEVDKSRLPGPLLAVSAQTVPQS